MKGWQKLITDFHKSCLKITKKHNVEEGKCLKFNELTMYISSSCYRSPFIVNTASKFTQELQISQLTVRVALNSFKSFLTKRQNNYERGIEWSLTSVEYLDTSRGIFVEQSNISMWADEYLDESSRISRISGTNTTYRWCSRCLSF